MKLSFNLINAIITLVFASVLVVFRFFEFSEMGYLIVAIFYFCYVLISIFIRFKVKTKGDQTKRKIK